MNSDHTNKESIKVKENASLAEKIFVILFIFSIFIIGWAVYHDIHIHKPAEDFTISRMD